MKKKLAILLAVVMVFSLLPMHVFGVRPGQVRDARDAPVHDVTSYLFRIDAAALSQLALDAGSMAVLDFVLSGGANAAEVGFAPFLIQPYIPGGTSWDDDVLDAAPGTFNFTTEAALEFSFIPGPNFRVNGDNDRAVLTSFTDFLSGIANTPGGEYVQLNSAGRFPAGARPNGGRQGFANLQFIDFEVPGGNGFGFRPSAASGAYVWERWGHPAPFTAFWRQVQINLFPDPSATGTWYDEFGATSNEFPTLEGWLDLRIDGIRASEDDAEINIYLLEGGALGAGGIARVTRTPLLTDARLFTGHGSGVNITAQSVVPMDGIGALSGIRIAEAVVGRFLSADPAHSGNEFNVRLVAPRGFVWDYNELQLPADTDATGRGVRAVGNVAFGGDNIALPGAVTLIPTTHAQWQTTGRTWSTPNSNPFENENTGRHELYLNIALPSRSVSFAARNTPAEVTIRGLSLIPVPGAATSGNLAIDVYIGDVEGPGILGYAHGSGTLGAEARNPARVQSWPAGSVWTERTPYANNWRARNLVVATLDWEGDLAVSGPATVETVRSGGWSVDWRDLPLLRAQTDGLHFTDNDRWLNGGNHTLRIAEAIQGNMFNVIDRYVLIPPEGVNIVDARIRAGRDGANTDTFGWGTFERSDFFIPGLHNFNDDGSMTFATRILSPESQARLRRMDIGLLLSVEAGFEAANGGEIEVRVYRNGRYSGSAVVAYVYDPIVVTQEDPARIVRNAFDVLALTPVAGFTITEADAGTLEHGDEIRFRLQATQNGREITIPHGEMDIVLATPVINTGDSGLELRELRGNNVLGFEVSRTSHGTAGEITFEEVFVIGPTAPGVEWHVVIYGPEISANSDRVLGDTDYVGGVNIGELTPILRGNDNQRLSDYVLRGRFYDMPYSATVLEVGGMAVIDEDHPAGRPGIGVSRRSFTTSTMINVDGHYIQAVYLATVAPGIVSTMMNPRVFSDFLELPPVQFDDAARTITFSGTSTHGTYQTVVLTLDSPVAMVNGSPLDIAVGAGQGALSGQISPVVIAGRSYVPARFLATIFGIGIEFTGNGVTLG